MKEIKRGFLPALTTTLTIGLAAHAELNAATNPQQSGIEILGVGGLAILGLIYQFRANMEISRLESEIESRKIRDRIRGH